MKNYYTILDIPCDASLQRIREQYLLLINAWHPDKFSNSAQKAIAEEKTKEINEAYSILRDSIKRSDYDLAYQRTYQNRSNLTNQPAPPIRRQQQTPPKVSVEETKSKLNNQRAIEEINRQIYYLNREISKLNKKPLKNPYYFAISITVTLSVLLVLASFSSSTAILPAIVCVVLAGVFIYLRNRIISEEKSNITMSITNKKWAISKLLHEREKISGEVNR